MKTVYFPLRDARFLSDVALEAQRARDRFPNSRNLLAALTEEVGELAQALLDRDRGEACDADVFKEAIQVAAVALRIALEGDTSLPSYVPPLLDTASGRWAFGVPESSVYGDEFPF